MSKNIKLNETDYNDISTVQLPTTDGGTATFKDTDEISIPSGAKTITENGTHDVTDFAQAIVNVAASSGETTSSIDTGTFTPTENTLIATVSTTAQRSNFLIWQDNIQVVADAGVRHLGLNFVTPNINDTNNWSMIGTTTAGTSWSAVRAEIAKHVLPRVTFNEDNIVFEASAGNGSGYMLAGQTYRWLAW